MAVSDVYKALNSAIYAPDSIDLWSAAGEQDLADLQPVLVLFGISGSYVLTNVSLIGDNTSVTLTGSGSFGQPGAGQDNIYPISATLTYTDSARFTLSLRVVGNRLWTFAAFFPILPDSMRTMATAGGIIWTQSFLVGSQPDYAVVVLSPSFTGANGAEELQFQGFLPEFADPDIQDRLGLLSPWPLRLSGAMSLPAGVDDFPLMQLTAQSSAGNNALSASNDAGVDGPKPLNLNALSLTIALTRLVEADYGEPGISELTLNGAFAIGGGLSGTISTPILSAGETWAFSAQFDPKTSSLTQGLVSLSSLFGVPLPIPADFPLLSAFHFAGFDADLKNKAHIEF